MDAKTPVPDLNEQIAGLSPAKRALLELKLKNVGGAASSSTEIPRRSERGKAPVSFAQQRLWILEQIEPGNAAYNIGWAWRVFGELDVEALREALNEIVRRHESLRTRFVAVDGQPLQVVSERVRFELWVVDLRQLQEAAREAEAERLAGEEAERPFDLSIGPLFRGSLLGLGEEDQILLLTMHHIVSDGWSMGVLYRELTTLYEAYSTGKSSPLEELAIQYADFAVWQREWLQGEELEKQLGYWREQLAGTPAVLELPVDHARGAVRSYRGARESMMASEEVTEGLRKLSRREGATVFMTLLAAFQALLSRYTGQEDIWVGIPIANRNRGKIEDLIGFFVNTLVMRTEVKGAETFRELLQRVKEVALGAYAHQDLPFEKLVEELQPERSIRRNPLFDVSFAMQNAPTAAVEFSGLRLVPWGVANRRTRFDLEVHTWEREERLGCTFIYNRDLFEAATIKRMAGHFEELLRGVAADAKQQVSQYELLKAEERTQILVGWNQTVTAYPREDCIQELFEAQVKDTPNSVALVFENRQLTYRELNRRANQLAHYLRQRGVGPEVLVGICMERSVEMVVGLLGILKAGGAYVPLDPSYPQERLSFMLEDARVPVLLVQQQLREKLPAHSAAVIALDADQEAIATESEENPENLCTAENLAYVIYTSGSTGRPKGVSVVHRGVLRLVKGTSYAKLTPDEVFLQFAPISFDASTFEVWGSLLNGARLVVMPPGLPSLTELGNALRRYGVTTLWLTAGLFHQIVETQLDSLRGVQQLLAGGDVLQVPHVAKVASELSGCQLINGYGPTENTTFTCCYRVKSEERLESTVPIGFPISNTEVYILGRKTEPVPGGVEGELYIGGDGLARGYLNDAALTAEKFVPNLFSGEGARLYRTGDRARYLADGRIEFLGRIDNQIKIRGFRVELGEVETTLVGHPQVREAVVLAREETKGERKLVAYVVASGGEEGLGRELRKFLKQQLPEYMVPATFVLLEALPLTPSGKINRRALLLMKGEESATAEQYAAPRTPAEEKLAEIWSAVLKRERIGIHDNFFDLGGHSLLAIKLMAEIEKAFGQRIPLVSLFQGSTIEYLAGLLGQDVASMSWPTLIEIQAGDSKPPLFCVSIPNVNALGYLSLARYLGPEQPVYGLQAQYPGGFEGDEHNRAVVGELATEYMQVMRAAQPNGPYQFVGMCRGAHIAYEIARRLEKEGQEVALLGILDTWILENTYSYYWYVEHYAGRVWSLLRMNPRNRLAFIKKKAQDFLANFGAIAGRDQTSRSRTINPLHETYFPGAQFVPPTYRGRIAVFRVRRQPLNRIRDKQLGWGRFSTGGVDVHIVPGKHGTVLQEPNVIGLAEELKKWLLKE